MARISPRSACVLLASGLLLLAGCNSGPDLPPLAPVRGVVTLDGDPLPRGNVQFIPDTDRGNGGPTATATIGPDGSYTLATAGEEGAMVGWHKVRILSQQPPKDETDTDPPSLIPLRYTRPEQSGLSYEVQAIEENVINIELSKQPPR